MHEGTSTDSGMKGIWEGGFFFFPFLIPIFAVSYDKREIRNYALLLPFFYNISVWIGKSHLNVFYSNITNVEVSEHFGILAKDFEFF